MTDFTQIMAFWTPGLPELIIILVIALLIFGKKLPEIARSIGKSLTEFKKGVSDMEETKDEFVQDVQKSSDDAAKRSQQQPQTSPENETDEQQEEQQD